MKAFSDRRHLLFGRHGHLNELLRKAEVPGVTALVARARMGKTWLLKELCRRLSEEGFLVGYFEFNGGRISHLLDAVGDLYERWLSSASFSDEFKQRWEEHRKNLPSIIGKAFGRSAEAGIGLISRSIGKWVRESFEVLSSEIMKLKTGGLDLAPSDYVIFMDLIKFLHKVSGKRICIVLDAWGISTGIDQEYLALNGFLNHLNTWPPTHVYLGIKDADESTKCMDLAGKLESNSGYASIFRLPPMDLRVESEQKRLFHHLRNEVPFTKTIDNELLLRYIDAYPGVLERWMGRIEGKAPDTLEELKKLADDAQNNRYPEFDRLFKDLSKGQRQFLITLALLPRLDERTWEVVNELVFSEEGLDQIDDLANLGILEQAMPPSFGHDTRHVWARRRVIEKFFHRSQKFGAQLIETIAQSITDQSPISWVNLGLLYSFKDWIKNLELKPLPNFCIATAVAVIDGYSLELETNLDCRNHLRTKSDKFKFLNSLWYFSRGLANQKDGNLQEAIQDYDQAIAHNPEYSSAYTNRGTARSKKGDMEDAIKDYDHAITLDPVNGRAYYNRGVTKSKLGDTVGELKDYDQAIKLNPEFAPAYYNLSCLFASRGELLKVLDYLERAFEFEETNKLLVLAESDSDFDSVRGESSFQQLLGRFRHKRQISSKYP